MPRIYVANATKQTNEFIYQLPESSRPFTKRIPPGEQLMVHEGPIADINAIIDHHAMYGMRNIADINPQQFAGLIYSIDRPIKSDKIMQIAEHNDVALDQMAEQARSEGLAALSDSLDQSAETTGAQVNNLEVEVIEDSKPGDQGDKLQETQTIVKGEAAGKKTGGRPRRH